MKTLPTTHHKLLTTHYSLNKGFTLVEILLVISILGLLSGGILLALNNAKPRSKARNIKRSADVETIANAVYQYATDNDGVFPSAITVTNTEICKTEAASCAGLIDLSILTDDTKYLVSIPIDPTGGSTNGTGYKIFKTSNNRVTVGAPSAEDGEVISVTR